MLKILECLDSAALAATRKRELDITRERAADLGRSALDAIERGCYLTTAGAKVVWSSEIQAACNAKVSHPPDERLPTPVKVMAAETRVQVSNETTLGAARRLVDAGMRPVALNFANGIQPGGGFLHGSRAQEEVLCRSSALYVTLVGDPMYTAHRGRPRPDSTDWAIYSPDVPVFRSDDGTALERPWSLSFITCAAPYAPRISQPESGDLLAQRMVRVLEIAQAHGHTALVLGAWGCGAFGNDVHRTAADFRAALEGRCDGIFSDVVFAVTDWSTDRRYLGPFQDVFS